MPACHEAAEAAQALHDVVAVMIHYRDPAIDDREERRRRELANALAMRPEVVARGGAWARLDEMSERHGQERPT